jgi:APA family basic amino acid/polyamine antiporter
MTHQPGQLRRGLRAQDAISLVVGTIIGTGIFLKTTTMCLYVGSPMLVLAAWAVAGALSLLGALVYAGLADAFPEAGGEYLYVRAAYGDLPAFLYGWQRFWISAPGSIAAYAVGSATFLSSVLPLGATGRAAAAVAFILGFSALNCLAVRVGGGVQTALTALKTLLVLGLSVAILCFADSGSLAHLSENGGVAPTWGAFGLAVLSALWAFDGWNNLPMAAGEVKDPARNIPVALLLGVAAVLGIYAMANIAYFYALPLPVILGASSRAHPDAPAVAALAARTVFGGRGTQLLALAMVISALGAMNGSILTSSRVPFALAKDGLFPRFLGRVSRGAGVPLRSVLVQAAWACVLALSGTFDQLTDWVVFASWIFYGLCGFAVIRLRRRSGPGPGFQVPFYPFLPLLFCAMALLLLGNAVVSAPRESAYGLAFVLAGIPVHFWLRRRERARGAPSP